MIEEAGNIQSNFLSRRNYFGTLERHQFETSEKDPVLYTPQIEDEVYFIYQGYEDSMQNYSYYINGPDTDTRKFIKALKKIEKKPTLKKVTNIEYAIPSSKLYAVYQKIKGKQSISKYMEVYARVNLNDVGSQTSKTEKKILFFPGQIGSKYFVPKSKYEDLLTVDLDSLIGKEFKTIYTHIPKVSITKYEDFNSELFKNSLYNCLEVQYRAGNKINTLRMCPWELILDTVHNESPCILDTIKESLLYHLRDERTTVRLLNKYSLFIPRVDTKQFPNYYHNVPVMMNMELIWERIQNGYYRSYQQMIADIRQIAINCEIFNFKGTELTKMAQFLSKEMEKRLVNVLIAEQIPIIRENPNPVSEEQSQSPIKITLRSARKRNRDPEVDISLLEKSANLQNNIKEEKVIVRGTRNQKKRDVKAQSKPVEPKKRRSSLEVVQDTPQVFLEKSLVSRLKSREKLSSGEEFTLSPKLSPAKSSLKIVISRPSRKSRLVNDDSE